MILTCTLIAAGLLTVQAPDTLQTVTVVADRGVVVSRTDTLTVTNAQDITELLLQSPAAFVSDNGGYAGLKTVSLRSMGSPLTAIYVDGVRVGNVQSGQCDLGIIGMENFSSVVVDYAQNSLSFVTARPSFISDRRFGGSVKFSAGSFGSYLPSARLDCKISDKMTLSVNAEGVFSKGDFIYGDNLKRENNDIKQGRGGLDLFGTMTGGDWHAKMRFNSTDRGTPGSTDYPSTSDRQKDNNVFAQGLLHKQFCPLYNLTASAKLSYDDLFYTNSLGESRYAQTEAQLNTSHKFSINSWLVVSFAADVFWDGLKSSAYKQQRLGTTEALTATFGTNRIRVDLSIQYDGVFDLGQKNRNNFSPSVDFKFTILEGLDIVAFSRRAYRVPTFNELYYLGYGNPDLKTEDAWLSDLGLDWKEKFGAWRPKVRFDSYYNFLRDKITSAPSPVDPNLWQPYNIGRVRCAGVDILAGFDFCKRDWLASISLRYNFQDAADKTPGSYTYDQQIAYAPKHSLSLNASAAFRGWTAQTAWNLRAERRDYYGEMPDWNTWDLFLSKSFDLGKGGIPALKLSFRNITDNRYELTSGYPMPGFSITGGIEYKF